MTAPAVLTFDLGTSSTKAALWVGDRLVGLARAPIATAHPRPGWAEQDPDDWWGTVVESAAAVRAVDGVAFTAVTAIGFSAARETFALLDADLRPLGPGILWSDQRAADSVADLGKPSTFRALTGVVGNAASHAAKVRWVARHRPTDFAQARWIVAPRDAVIARLTGRVVTDVTLASRTGWFALTGGWTEAGRALLGARLPEVLASTARAGEVHAAAAAELGLRAGTPVIVGAGDRQCEALGVGASPSAPMVSWGTTANVSVPHPGPVSLLPTVAAVSRAAPGDGFLLEAGLSASGAAMDWIGTLTGRDPEALWRLAADVEPGARGVLALPWLNGARGPWWEPGVHAAFLGLTAAHGPAELARATIEAVAFDVARCLELLGTGPGALALAGAGAANPVWREIVAAATGRSWTRRRHDDAASVGARLLVANALGEPLTLADLNPVVASDAADPALVARYRRVRTAADAVAIGVLAIDPRSGPTGPE